MSLGMQSPYRGDNRGSAPARRRRRAAAGAVPVALLGAAIALAGCSVKARDTISARSMAAEIAAQLSRTYNITRPPVRCPSTVPAQVGSEFTCTATLDGQHLGVNAKVTSTAGRVDVRLTRAVIVTRAAEAEIGRDMAKASGLGVTVSCPVPALLVAPTGHVFTCAARVGTVEREVAVTVTSLSGALRYRVLPYNPARPGTTG